MNNGFFSIGYNRILASGVLAVGILTLVSYAVLNFEQAKNADYMRPSISVSGEGEVTSIPDVAQFSFSVTSQGATAEVAQSDSATKTNAIQAYLKEQGVAEADIEVSGYNLYPKYRYEEQPCPFGGYCPAGEQIEDGFEVYQSVMVKVRDIAKAGPLLSGVGEKGATNISGVTFTVDDTDAAEAEAQKLAIADAKAKAEVLAADLGVKLVRLTNYYVETPFNYGYESTYMANEMKMDAAVSPELPAGEETTTVSVNLTFEIK